LSTILVVGGAGYIGSHMVKQLKRAGFAVIFIFVGCSFEKLT
jgi:UDP-glucose 4-epimerase